MIISDITSYDDRLTVRWSDGGETNFDWFWLRDHGEDEGSLDPDTLQRRVDTFALDTGIRPEACSVADNGRTLQISWPGKGEPGLHSTAALASQAGLAPDNADLAPETNQCLWSAEAPLSLPDPVAFGDFMETGAGHRTVLERIHVNGFAVIEGVPTDETSGRRLYERIGYIRESIFGGGWTPSSEVKEHKDRLSLRIVCMDVRWRLRGKPGVRRSPVQAVGTIAGSCRDIWSRRLGSAARNPSTGCVGC